MATVEIECRACSSNKVYKHGKARSGEQRYRCRDCGHSFQQDYRYTANKPGVAEKIVEMAMNGSGIRDTSRVLGISTNTVLAHLKNSNRRKSHRCLLIK